LRRAGTSAERRHALNRAPQHQIAIPRFEILRLLGRSANSEVYLAATETHEENVALKVSHEELAPGVDAFQLLAREYRALSAVEHPGVVGIYDYGVHAGREFLAMEYFPAGDLRQRMDQGISTAAAIDCARSISAALQAVHAAGLVHRDLKPQNVMMRGNGDAVLIDFGLAKILDGSASTRTGVLRGSPYYMSPEQAQGAPVDARSDLYSLGVMLYEMLAQRKPYYGENAVDLLKQHVHAPVPRLPEELRLFQPLIERLLAKSPDERYANAAELSVALAA
jgi:serine/threonine protein kinase